MQLLGSLPRAEELTVEANPETVTAELAALLRRAGVDRVSLGAQTFEPRLLDVLGRVATPDDVRRAVYALRDAGFDNISIDLIYGIPGQEPADLEADLAQAVELQPEHVSAYELEAKPGTRFTHAHGAALELQAEAMETYFETVVATLSGAGYRWYETANFCLGPVSRWRARSAGEAQSRLLARARLPRPWGRCRRHSGRPPYPQHPVSRAISRGARERSAAAARDRGAATRRAGSGAPDARAPARRIAAARRRPRCDRSIRARTSGTAQASSRPAAARSR